jgi:hypothetical protein
MHAHSDFLNTTFREGWRFFLPNPGGFFDERRLMELYDSRIRNFLNLVINNTSLNFSTFEFVQNLTEAITDFFGNLLSGGNMTIRNCTIQQLVINESARSVMANQLEILRSGITALINYEQFLTNYSQNTSFEFPDNCVNELIRISFCGRCNSTFPPLCSRTCGALIRGCYSPYYDALPEEFNLLWNVSIQVIQVLNTNLQGIFTEGRRLFNNIMMVSIIYVHLIARHW